MLLPHNSPSLSESLEFLDTVVIISFPPPFERNINYFPRPLYGVKCFEGRRKYRSLLWDIKRLPKWMSKGPSEMDGAWRFHLDRIFLHKRYANGRNTTMFYCPLYQSDGLVTDSSARCEQDDINAGSLQKLRNLRCGFAD